MTLLNDIAGYLAAHWGWAWGVLGVAAAYVASLVTRSSAARKERIDRDTEDVRRRVAEIAAEQGAAAAHAAVQQTYNAEMEALSGSEQKEASLLVGNPEKLAAFVVRASGTDKKPS